MLNKIADTLESAAHLVRQTANEESAEVRTTILNIVGNTLVNSAKYLFRMVFLDKALGMMKTEFPEVYARVAAQMKEQERESRP